MNTASVTQLRSSGMQELTELFNSLKKPYGLSDIVRFNLVYQRLYPQLNKSEKRRAEELVDTLLENLESGGLAAKIYGVV